MSRTNGGERVSPNAWAWGRGPHGQPIGVGRPKNGRLRKRGRRFQKGRR